MKEITPEEPEEEIPAWVPPPIKKYTEKDLDKFKFDGKLKLKPDKSKFKMSFGISKDSEIEIKFAPNKILPSNKFED